MSDHIRYRDEVKAPPAHPKDRGFLGPEVSIPTAGTSRPV